MHISVLCQMSSLNTQFTCAYNLSIDVIKLFKCSDYERGATLVKPKSYFIHNFISHSEGSDACFPSVMLNKWHAH